MPKLCCYCFSPKIVRFHNGSNKVAIELRVMQFWSEIILVISNQTRATRSFDFEITRMISDQIALHSVQLPLLIVFNWFSFLCLVSIFDGFAYHCICFADPQSPVFYAGLTRGRQTGFGRRTFTGRGWFSLDGEFFVRRENYVQRYEGMKSRTPS